MKTIATNIKINAPIETVWQILSNFEAYPSWNPFIVSLKGKLALGETIRTILISNGKENHFKPDITVLEEGQKFEWVGSLPLGMFVGNHYFRLEKIDAHTTRFVHGENFSGWLSGLILLLIKKETTRGFLAMNEALKIKAEQ
jgi:hypothetical protein